MEMCTDRLFILDLQGRFLDPSPIHMDLVTRKKTAADQLLPACTVHDTWLDRSHVMIGVLIVDKLFLDSSFNIYKVDVILLQ